jgi:hypothetical protein
VNWKRVGTGLSYTAPQLPGTIANVSALAVYDVGAGPELYVAGSFDTAGGQPAANIARWNGSTWSAVAGGVGGHVWGLEAFDDGTGLRLYAGGAFTTAGGASTVGAARYGPSGWSSVSSGQFGNLTDFQVFDDGNGPKLYCATQFQVRDVGRWNGSSWTQLGCANVRPTSLALYDDGHGERLCAGGDAPAGRPSPPSPSRLGMAAGGPTCPRG